MTFQINSDGEVRTGEFSEVSYSGKGNGDTSNDLYIDTGVVCTDIETFEITFKHKLNTLGRYQSIAGAMIGTTEYFWIRVAPTTSIVGVYLQYPSPVYAIPALVEDNIYKITITKEVAANTWTVTVYNITTETEIYNNSQVHTGNIPSNNLWIYARDHLNGSYHYHNDFTIYSFKINDETWYINEGEGTTITGDDGTALTISGTTTNFWEVQTDVFNYSSNFNIEEGDIAHAPEFNEVQYSGTGNGTDIKIDTGIIGNDIDEFEIKFKLPVKAEQNAYGNLFGNIVTGGYFTCYMGSTYFCRVRLDASLSTFNFESSVTEGEIYTLKITKNSTSNFTVTVTHNDGIVVYTKTSTVAATTYGTSNCYIYDRNYGTSYPSKAEVYYYKINDEIFYINEGEGSLVIGTEGTEHTIDGTLTNFWNESDIPNLDAQMKSYSDETKVMKEIIEV